MVGDAIASALQIKKECSFSYTYTVCVIGNTLCIIVLLNSLLNLKVIVKVGCLNTYCTINLRNKLNNSFFIHFSTTLLSLYYVIMTSGLFPFLHRLFQAEHPQILNIFFDHDYIVSLSHTMFPPHIILNRLKYLTSRIKLFNKVTYKITTNIIKKCYKHRC